MIAWESWRGHSGTQQYAYPGRGYYILHGVWWPDMMAPGAMAKKSRKSVRLWSTYRVVLSEGLKDIHGQRYQGDHCGCVYSHMIAHG